MHLQHFVIAVFFVGGAYGGGFPNYFYSYQAPAPFQYNPGVIYQPSPIAPVFPQYVTPGYPQFPIYQQFPQYQPVQPQQPIQPIQPPQQSESADSVTVESARSTFEDTSRNDPFRGFAYNVEFDHGARSQVVFVTGPEVHNLRKNMPSFTVSRTAASDAVDANAQANSEQTSSANNAIDVVANVFRSSNVGQVQNFYAINNELVTKNLDTIVTSTLAPQPATLPPHPVSPIFTVLRSNFNLDTNKNDEPQESASEEKAVTAAAQTEPATTSTTPIPTSTTAASSTAATTTQQATTEATNEQEKTTEAASTSAPVKRSTMEPIIVE